MHSSGDFLADRRYVYAETALKEGDLAAAVDLARQALEIAPDFAAAWFLLGEARVAEYAAGAPSDLAPYHDAVGAFEAALAADPEDRLGAALRLARLSIGDPLQAMSSGYVRAVFDEYAVRFDRHLTSSLKYRAPALLLDAVRRAASRELRDLAFSRVLDLGCGTGLAGEAFRPLCGHLAGIDLSPAMVERARRKAIYDELATGDLLAFLDGREAGSADLVLAADVFVYVADLAPVFAGVARILAKDGLFAFSVQSHARPGVALGEDLRYAHGDAHLRDLSAATGLRIVLSEAVSTREDRGVPVPGRIYVLGSPWSS